MKKMSALVKTAVTLNFSPDFVAFATKEELERVLFCSHRISTIPDSPLTVYQLLQSRLQTEVSDIISLVSGETVVFGKVEK